MWEILSLGCILTANRWAQDSLINVKGIWGSEQPASFLYSDRAARRRPIVLSPSEGAACMDLSSEVTLYCEDLFRGCLLLRTACLLHRGLLPLCIQGTLTTPVIYWSWLSHRASAFSCSSPEGSQRDSPSWALPGWGLETCYKRQILVWKLSIVHLDEAL